MACNDPEGTILGTFAIWYKLCYTLLQSDTDVCTVCYDEPHGTIFDSLAGSQKPGNDHRIKLHFYHHYYLCTPIGVIIII